MFNFLSESPQETIKLGKKISKVLKPGFIVGLYGNLGSGKTTLVKGIAEGLGVKGDEINSPSFILIREYLGKLPLFHFDLYRLDKISQIEELGYEEYFFGEGVCVIEWAEKLNGLMPKEHLEVKISHRGRKKRLIKITAKGKEYQDFLSKLLKE